MNYKIERADMSLSTKIQLEYLFKVWKEEVASKWSGIDGPRAEHFIEWAKNKLDQWIKAGEGEECLTIRNK